MTMDFNSPDFGTRTPARKSGPPSVWKQSAVLVGGFAILLYVIEIVDVISGQNVQNAGVTPRTLDGLWGILFAPGASTSAPAAPDRSATSTASCSRRRLESTWCMCRTGAAHR